MLVTIFMVKLFGKTDSQRPAGPSIGLTVTNGVFLSTCLHYQEWVPQGCYRTHRISGQCSHQLQNRLLFYRLNCVCLSVCLSVYLSDCVAFTLKHILCCVIWMAHLIWRVDLHVSETSVSNRTIPGARSEACPLGMQATPSSIPTSDSSFRGDLAMKKFLCPFSLFR